MLMYKRFCTRIVMYKGCHDEVDVIHMVLYGNSMKLSWPINRGEGAAI